MELLLTRGREAIMSRRSLICRNPLNQLKTQPHWPMRANHVAFGHQDWNIRWPKNWWRVRSCHYRSINLKTHDVILILGRQTAGLFVGDQPPWQPAHAAHPQRGREQLRRVLLPGPQPVRIRPEDHRRFRWVGLIEPTFQSASNSYISTRPEIILYNRFGDICYCCC